MDLTKHWASTLDDYVIDLAWSPDSTLLAAASSAGPVTVFAAADGTRRQELPGHENGTNAIAWMPAGIKAQIPNTKYQNSELKTQGPKLKAENPMLATGGQDGAVKFWDPSTGRHLSTAKLGSTWVEHLAWNPEGGGQKAEDRMIADSNAILAAAAGKNLWLLNADGTVRHTFKPAPKTITAIAWKPFCTGSVPQTSDLTPHTSALAAAYFGGVCIWNTETHSVEKEYAYANGIHALAWSPDGRWLVSGNQDPSVHLWIPAENVELHMSGYETKVKHLAFDHTSHWLATGGGRNACVWDCTGEGPEGREPLMFPHDAPICALSFQHTHGLLASASEDGIVMLWSPDRKQPLRATVKMPVAATKLTWSPDDRYLAIGSEKGQVYVLLAE